MYMCSIYFFIRFYGNLQRINAAHPAHRRNSLTIRNTQQFTQP